MQLLRLAIGCLFLSSISLAEVEKRVIGAANTLPKNIKKTSELSRRGRDGNGVLSNQQTPVRAQPGAKAVQNDVRVTRTKNELPQPVVSKDRREESPLHSKTGEAKQQYIGYRPQCAVDVDSLCPHVQRENNFQVLFCLQRQPNDVSNECHQASKS
jgi:hypothetical protein